MLRMDLKILNKIIILFLIQFLDFVKFALITYMLKFKVKL